MLNEDLMDPKDLKIAKLKLAIESFKKYDKERKEYYSKSLIELGQLKDYVEELEELAKDDKKLEKIQNLRREVKTLQNKISCYKDQIERLDNILQAYKNKEILEPELVQLNFYKERFLELKSKFDLNLETNINRFKKLRDKIRNQRKSIDELCNKIAVYENIIGEYDKL